MTEVSSQYFGGLVIEMKRRLIAGLAVLFLATTAQAKSVKLIHMCAANEGVTGVVATYLAEVASANNIATIQSSCGKTLTKTMQAVAEGKVDISASPFILNFLMAKGLGPYSGLGKEKGRKYADNLRILYSYNIAMYFLVSFQAKGIDSWDKIRGKTIHNGPPRGGALTTARALVRFATGMSEGKGYTGKQVVWGSANALFLDGGVDASVRTGSNPPPWIYQFLAAGKLNIVSFPKAKFNSKGFQKFAHGPGNVPVVLPISGLKFGGAKVISEDNMFRTITQTAGDAVNKSMSKTLAKKLTAAFIKNLGELQKKTPWAPGALYGSTDNAEMGYCKVGVKFHPGAVEAWEEAGRKIPACAKP